MSLRICHLSACETEEQEEKCARKLPTHCNEMITDGVAGFAKKGKFCSLGQRFFGPPREDNGPGHVLFFISFRHFGSSQYVTGEMVTVTPYKKEKEKQQEMRTGAVERCVYEEKEVKICNDLASYFGRIL